MAESKRIQLVDLRTFPKEERTTEVAPTLRFNLTVEEPTDSACTEYFYGDLVKASFAENGENNTQRANPFGDDDDSDKELQEIARKFEEKYNPKPGRNKKKKLGDWEDYDNIGMGYDETDSFIDNEEAYDPVVPPELITQFGGFYVNTGVLKFRNANELENTLDEKRQGKEISAMEGEKRKISSDGEVRKRKRRKSRNQTMNGLPKVESENRPTVANTVKKSLSTICGEIESRLGAAAESEKSTVDFVNDGVRENRNVDDPENVLDEKLLNKKRRKEISAVERRKRKKNSDCSEVLRGRKSLSQTAKTSPKVKRQSSLSTIDDVIESVVKAARDANSNDDSVGQPTVSTPSGEFPFNEKLSAVHPNAS